MSLLAHVEKELWSLLFDNSIRGKEVKLWWASSIPELDALLTSSSSRSGTSQSKRATAEGKPSSNTGRITPKQRLERVTTLLRHRRDRRSERYRPLLHTLLKLVRLSFGFMALILVLGVRAPSFSSCQTSSEAPAQLHVCRRLQGQ